MSKKTVALLLCLALLLSGCVYRAAADEGLYTSVYRLNALEKGGGALLLRQTVEYSEGENVLDIMLRALNSQPETTAMERVFPEGVEALRVRIDRGVATVSLSEGYYKLSEVEKLLTESCITLSFMSLDHVCSVSIECAGRTIRSGLSAESIEQADELFESYERLVKLYLPAEGGLVPRSVLVTMTGGDDVESLIAAELLSLLPLGTDGDDLLSVETTEGVCRVDFSRAFYGSEPTDKTAGRLYVYAIVNSLCRLPNVDSVVISVEGETLESYGGFRPQWPLEADESIIIY